VSNTLGHRKCSSKIAKLFAKAVYGTIVCHIKQAAMRFKGSSETGAGNSEENCEDNPGNSAKGTLDDGLTNLAASGLCDPTQLANAAVEEAVLFNPGPLSLDGQNGIIYCDSSSAVLIGDDDTGWVANSANRFTCEAGVAKAVGKLVRAAIKCHDKMNSSFFKAKDFAEESCEEIDPLKPTSGALAKFNSARDKLISLGICPPCLDGPSQDVQAASALAQLDAANSVAYPCGLAP
jgi:hypothetical protein